MSLLKVALFGRFCVQCGDQIVGGFDASKVQELFTYLLLYRHRSHPRETLAGILWGDSSTAQSKKYLRQALWQMQSALEASTTIAAEDLFLLEANWINLNPAAPLWLDVAAFETAYNRVQGVPGQALDGQQLKTVHDAVELYRGDLLEGWYQDWCWYERERFQTMYLSLLDKLIDYYQANGEYETAIDYAQRVLRCDHAREHTHQRLMILHYLAGDRVAALRAAAVRMSDREACAAKLAQAFLAASPANQVVLLELLGQVGGQKALATVAARVQSSDPALLDAATRVLGDWPSADAAPVLLDIVKSDADAKLQIRAMRGYIRIARQFQMPADARLAMFQTAMELAKRNEEKVVALDILTRIPSAQTLALAASRAADPALKAAAADAAVKIAVKLVGRDPNAVAAAMQKIVDAKLGGDVEARAAQLLGQANSAAR